MEEVVKKAEDIKLKSEEAHSARGKINTTDFPRSWLATKSIMKNYDTETERPVIRASPIRIGPPVQGRMSLRTMKTSPPCFCLLDEIRKNNLVMKEDVFSSSTPRIPEFPNALAQKAGRSISNNDDISTDRASNRQQSRNVEMEMSSNTQQNIIGATYGKANVMQPQNTTPEAAEVYEATGGVENSVGPKAQQKEGTRQDPTASDINAQAANIRYVRNQFDEFWRPFNSPKQSDFRETNEQTKPKPAIPPIVLSPEAIAALQETKQDRQPLVSQNNRNNTSQPVLRNDLTSERHFHQMNEYLEAKTSTPNRRQEKYVKLPGLAEAFVQRGSNFKDIRIKDGTSFESVNALEEMSMRNIANQILETQNTNEHEERSMRKVANRILDSMNTNIPGMEVLEMGQRKPETKDAATDFRTPLKNTKTQTGDLEKVDCFVQCESYIVDEADGRNVVKNDHQEIMVCDDNGDGVQLYNELGHPLTDMDGYLLKDSLGRFLVRLDQYGVPISCTNGQAIFMDDSKPWNKVKHTLSIIHQARKKPIKRETIARKGKARPSLRQLECAMNNLRSTLEWAEKTSLGSSQENSLNRLIGFDHGEHRPMGNVIPTLDAAKLKNNTNSLLDEMKSIARLRNALLEKVNFIVENKNKLRKSGKNAKLGGKPRSKQVQEPYMGNWLNVSTSVREHQDRPYSPTYQAIKKLRESETKYEANLEINSLSAGSLTQHFPSLSQTDGVHMKGGVDLWKNMVSSISYGNDFQIKKESGGDRQKIERDLWINDKPDNRINANSPEVKHPGTNENKKDLWDFIHDKSMDKSVPNSNDKFPTPQMNGYPKLDEDLDLSDVRLVSKDTNNIIGVSSLKGPEDSSVTGSQLLISLEKEYNLTDNSWLGPWKTDKSPWEIKTPDRNKKATSGMWSETRPSIEISSCSSNNF